LTGDLPKNSSSRNYFEKEEKLYAFGCYGEDKASLIQYIRDTFSKENFTINYETIEFLANILNNKEFFIAQNEINKLISYNYHKKTISVEDIEKVLSDDIEFSPDELCKYFLLDLEKYNLELDNILKSGISPIWILRALGRYFSNLYLVKLDVAQHHANFDEAIKILKPPLFYKYIPSFKTHLNKLSLNEIIFIAQEINNMEAKCKKGNISAKSLLSELYFIKLHKLVNAN
jgi:DNA polymerase-3 subunit delta